MYTLVHEATLASETWLEASGSFYHASHSFAVVHVYTTSHIDFGIFFGI